MQRSRIALLFTVCLSVVALPGCGGDDTDGDGPANGAGAGGSASAGGAGGTGGASTEICELPKHGGGGQCAANFPSFWHNPETDLCEPFIYGGCNGTENRFETLAACEAACGDE